MQRTKVLQLIVAQHWRDVVLDNLLVAVVGASSGFCLYVLKPLGHKCVDLCLAGFHEGTSSELVDHLSQLGFGYLTVTVNPLPVLVTLAVLVASEVNSDIEHSR